MISRAPDSLLYKLARSILSLETVSIKSWFWEIRDLCLSYHLPHPLTILSTPPTKEAFKKMVKTHIIDYWEQVLRAEASILPSLEFFNPSFMSLTRAHPIWSTAGSSPSNIAMATTQSQMLSGRYRTQLLISNWSRHTTGFCILSQSCSSTIEDLPHILSCCEALQPAREKLQRFALEYFKNFPEIQPLAFKFCQPTHPKFCQFLLDCSVIPEVILATQMHGQGILHHLFHVTRTWVYALHRTRMKMLGRWNYF